MTQITRARRVLWPLFVIALGIALVSVAVKFRRLAASPAAPSPLPSKPKVAAEAKEGVVCFGTVALEHGIASLNPLQPGRVALVLVAENQEVAQGAELLQLDDAAARSKLIEAEVGVELAQLQLSQAHKQPGLRAIRVAQQQAVLDAMTSRVAAARLVRAREEKLAQSVVVTQSDPSINNEKIRELEALERAETKRLAEIESQDVAVEIRRAEYALKAAESRREQARLALDECSLRAPRPGTVLRVLVAPGDVVSGQPGQPAMLFAAAGPQVIRATIEQEFAGRVKEGAQALVRDEAEPTVTWRGRVTRLAAWYAERRTVLHDPSQFSDVRTLECVIALEPSQPRLRLGQSVRIEIGPVP